MPRVRLDFLQEGMITAREIKNMDGTLLIPAGAALGSRHISLLRTWGIPEIAVQTCAGSEGVSERAAALPSDELAALDRELRSRFHGLQESNEAQMEVFRLCLERKTARRSCDHGQQH